MQPPSALVHALTRRVWANRVLRALVVVAASSGTLTTASLVVVLRRAMCDGYAEATLLLARLALEVAKTVASAAGRGFRPLMPHWTLGFELVCAMIRTCTRLQGEKMVEYEHARTIRAYSEAFGSLTGWFSRRAHQRRLETVSFNELEHLWLRSTTKSPRSARIVVMFVHGGAFAILSPQLYMSFCCAFTRAIEIELERRGARRTAVDAFVANYRKAPENPFPAPPQDVVTMYDYLLTHEKLDPNRIVLAGDSAGGSLVMSTLIRIRNRALEDPTHPQAQLPRAAVLICPAADMTNEWEEEHRERENPYCIISHSMLGAGRAAYHRSAHDESTWHDASAVHSDLSGLPPVMIQAAKLDLLVEHSERLFEKADEDGATRDAGWELDMHEHMPHVFTVFPVSLLPYAGVGMQHAAKFVAKNVLTPVKKSVATPGREAAAA